MADNSTGSANSTSSSSSSTTNTSTCDYWVGVTIGEGRFGHVVYGQHKHSQKEVAIKVYDKASMHKYPFLPRSIWTERLVLQQELASVESVVNLWSAFHDSHCVYLIMECNKGGTLQEVLPLLSKNRQGSSTSIAHYALQLCHSIQALHDRSIIHTDLSPQNILLTSRGRIQIADFGAAVRLGQDDPATTNQQSPAVPRGTADYASPEIIRGIPASQLTPAVDLWSLGCILFAILHGQPPFHAPSDSLAIQSIMDYVNNKQGSSLQSFASDKYSTAWKQLIWDVLLQPDPTKRMIQPPSSMVQLIPGHDTVDLEQDPPIRPNEPQWVQEQQESKQMKDGSSGWTAFLM
ncbi:Protein kinase [Seminavis robusta]|uniref:Protein kinase n=1 Tax=Seminavis robusta TaxID=568900 RepID=A0A9N8HWP2_9STRA|nr:Protein kinase [Seminavis robusta]|eukprot:Sro2010_g310820.1 Protein kinase (348) ;mRNA; f:10372-11415